MVLNGAETASSRAHTHADATDACKGMSARNASYQQLASVGTHMHASSLYSSPRCRKALLHNGLAYKGCKRTKVGARRC